MTTTPSQRSQQARAAAYAMHAKNDSRRTSQPGRDAFLARFEKQVDPEGTLAPNERARRAQRALKAHMASLALKSSRRRSA